jgi:hypothetical protein
MSTPQIWLLVVFLIALVVAAVARWKGMLGRGVQMAFLLRFPGFLILSPGLIILLSCAASTRTIFGNLVILDAARGAWWDRFWGGFWVAAAGFASAYLALVVTTTVLDHACERFSVQVKVPQWFWDWKGAFFSLPPLALLVWVYFQSSSAAGSAGISRAVPFGLAGGLVAALGTIYVIELIFQGLEPPGRYNRERSLAFPAGFFCQFVRCADPLRWVAKVAGWLWSLPGVAKVAGWLWSLPGVAKVAGWLRRPFGSGYIDRPPGSAPGSNRPYPEHIVLALALAMVIAVYIINFYLGWKRLSLQALGTTKIPTLAYLEFLILAFALVLSGAAFWFDCYRIPVLVAVIAYTFAVSIISMDTDHYWKALPPSAAAQSKGDDLDAWLAFYSGGKADQILRVGADRKPVVVVVCASGGGIEAAAWTAKVLTGLQAGLGPQLGEQFARSIRLISSTSGGSVGALFFIESFLRANPAPETSPQINAPQNLQRIVDAAETPSLDAAGWGFVYPDFARLLAPWLLPLMLGHDREIDRGWALEQALRVALKDADGKPVDIRTKLSDWRAKVRQGWLPATVFNATLVETGNPLLLSTAELQLPEHSVAVVFGTQRSRINSRVVPLEGADIYAVTAARLSASFPYVSPVTRPQPVDLNVPDMHVADGGYYDNYGITVAVEWLNDIIKRHQLNDAIKPQLGKIAIIEIDAFPEEEKKAQYEEYGGTRSQAMGGWSSEFIGPVKSVVNARTSTQLGRDLIELDLLNNLNCAANKQSLGSQNCPEFIKSFRFVAQHDGPLSWQLSPDQKANITNDWKTARVQKTAKELRCFIKPELAECQ